MLERYLLVWLVLLCGIALQWNFSFDPFLATKPYLFSMITTIMFLVGCLLTREEVREVFRRWPRVLFGTAVQYTAMPLLAFLATLLIPMDPQFALGVIVVGCVPGAMASNVITHTAKGNVSYSVCLTTSSTILSPVVVPLALWLTLGKTRSLDLLGVGRDLLLQVAAPVILGYIVRQWTEQWARKLASPLAHLVILWLIAVVVADNRAALYALSGLGGGIGNMLLALILVNLLGYLAGYYAGVLVKLDQGSIRALAIEIGMQNAGLGTALLSKMYPEEKLATIPTAIYTVGCVLTASLLAMYWSARGKR